jgi:hypothetical protein
MFRSVCVAASAIALASSQLASAQSTPSLEVDAIAFGTREAVHQADVSPDGSKAVFVEQDPDDQRSSIWPT